MSSLLRFLRSLGPAGALANAAQPLDARRHEDRVVGEVARRFGTLAPASRPVPVPRRTPLAA